MKTYLPLLLVALAGTASAMDRDDVLTMLRRGAQEDTIFLAMQEDYNDFGLNTEALEELRNSGASDNLLNAVTGGLVYLSHTRNTGFLRVVNNTRQPLYHGKNDRRRELYVHSEWKPDLTNTQAESVVKVYRVKETTYRLRWPGYLSSIRVPVDEDKTTEVILQPELNDEDDLQVIVRQDGRTVERRVLKSNVLKTDEEEEEETQNMATPAPPVVVTPPIVTTPAYTVRQYEYPNYTYSRAPRIYYRSYRSPHYSSRSMCRRSAVSCRCPYHTHYRSLRSRHSRHPVIIQRKGCHPYTRSRSGFGFSIRF